MKTVEACTFRQKAFRQERGIFMGKKSGKAKGTGVGIICFGAAFALISAIFHPHKLFSYIFTTIVSGIIGIVGGIMGSGLDTTTHNKQDEALEMVKEDTGNAEVDAVLAKGRELIQEIRTENDLIPDSRLSMQLDALERECAEVFSIVYDKPEKISQIRKFMEYYLPTTLKMVKAYRMLDERGVPGREAALAKQRIGDVIDAVIQGAQKLKENLYQDDVLDINTDIDVMEQMLKRDGLTESDLQRVAAQARQAAQLDQAIYEAEKKQKEEQAKQSAVQSQAYSGSGVDSRMNQIRESAQNHVPSVPTMNGGVYPNTASAFAQAEYKDQ